MLLGLYQCKFQLVIINEENYSKSLDIQIGIQDSEVSKLVRREPGFWLSRITASFSSQDSSSPHHITKRVAALVQSEISQQIADSKPPTFDLYGTEFSHTIRVILREIQYLPFVGCTSIRDGNGHGFGDSVALWLLPCSCVPIDLWRSASVQRQALSSHFFIIVCLFLVSILPLSILIQANLNVFQAHIRGQSSRSKGYVN